jgi:Domain of unknown function (DUF4265)
MNNDDKSVKILFRYYSNVLEEETVETMWAEVVDIEKGLYKLDNIPFYGPIVASNDIVFAEYDDCELMLTYRNTVESSGNSIVQVMLMKDDLMINDIRKVFEDMGCISERANDKYFVMEITADKDYKVIKQKLDEFESEGLIGYAEPCLSILHQY